MKPRLTPFVPRLLATLIASLVLTLSVIANADAQTRAPRAPEWAAPAASAIRPAFADGGLAVTAGLDAAVMQATSIENPTTVDFTASPDHNVVQNTVPLLTRYDLEVYTGSTLVKTQSLGKPTPGTGNLISYTQLQTVLASVAPADYTAKIAAVGPGGTTRSAASNPFTVAVRSPAAPPGTPVVR